MAELDNIREREIPGALIGKIIITSLAPSQISASVMPNASAVDSTGLPVNISKNSRFKYSCFENSCFENYCHIGACSLDHRFAALMQANINRIFMLAESNWNNRQSSEFH